MRRYRAKGTEDKVGHTTTDISDVWYVVLHYGSLAPTIRCINSLLAQSVSSDSTLHVLVVENGYTQARDERLEEMFCDDACVDFIRSHDNLGFAAGNNLGYTRVKHSIDAGGRCIAVFLNNDTEVPDADFTERLLVEYRRRPFDILSPDIYDPAVMQHQSPLCAGSDIDDYAYGEYVRAKALLSQSRAKKAGRAIKNRLTALVGYSKHGRNVIASKRAVAAPSSNWREAQEDVVPQGSAVIFGPSYLSECDVAFDEMTFMYFEECLLKKRCDRLHLSIRYTPCLQVLHHHNEITAKSLEQNTFRKALKCAQLTVSAYEAYVKA